MDSAFDFRTDSMYYAVDKHAVSDPTKLGKRMVRVVAQNSFGFDSKSFHVKIGTSCLINTFEPDPTDIIDPLTRYSKQYHYKVGDPLLKIPFKDFLPDVICGQPITFRFQ